MANKVFIHEVYKDKKTAIKEGELRARENKMQWVVLEKSQDKQVFKVMAYKEYLLLLKENKKIEDIAYVCKTHKRKNLFNEQ